MILTSELRRGNYCFYKNINFYPINTEVISIWEHHLDLQNLDLRDEYQNRISHDEVFPIPLTEEWLIKLGFQKDRHYYHIKDSLPEMYVEYYLADNEYSFYIYLNEDWHCLYSDIQSVHKLQNLYFALTGTELEIIL